MNPAAMQLDLFASVAAAYGNGPLHNADLYRIVARDQGISDDEALHARIPIGRSKTLRSPFQRRVRWFQQSLRALSVLQHVPGQRGVWQLTEAASGELMKVREGVRMVAFSTELGVAIWGRAADVFPGLHESIHLAISSPPYPLRVPRAYGNPANEAAYVDFICRTFEPIVRQLVPGGSVVLNVGQDIFEPGLPSRSLFIERLVLALHDRLGLHLMDRIPWVNYSKPPGPTRHACVDRVQLSAAYEPIWWFSNLPSQVRADNLRVRLPHTERHQRLMDAGGEQRDASYGDGAYRIRPGSFAGTGAGRIPRNVIERGHRCRDTLAYRALARNLGLPVHGAMQPTAISDFFIKFLTEEGDLVVDPFGGTVRAGLAAQRLNRRWLVTEWLLPYLRGAAELFRGFDGFRMPAAITNAYGLPRALDKGYDVEPSANGSKALRMQGHGKAIAW